MKKEFRLLLFLVSVLFSFCKEPFDPNIITGASVDNLIVEGVINTAGATNISLTHALKLSDKLAVKGELKAQVQVEGETSGTFPLTETGSGVYTVAQLNLSQTQKYRLRIKTSAGKIYLSDFVSVKATPLIDSVNWVRNNNGVQIYVNTHDAKKETRYYLWDYEETWEQHSTRFSTYKLGLNAAKKSTLVARDAAETDKLFYCWKNQKATNLLIASTAKLTDDVVYLNPLLFIPNGSDRLKIRYSVLVKQYAISREAFEYLSLMKNNSEQAGSLFDTQPTEIKGNIHNASDPNELVIGYVQIASTAEKRIFIDDYQVPNWTIDLTCQEVVVPNIADSLDYFFGHAGYIPTDIAEGDARFIIKITGTSATCADCRLRGGNNDKPLFW